jgi:surfeit locus 1 family protein
MPVLLGLGVWQLERAAWKQGLIDAYAERARQAPVQLEALLAAAEPVEYRPVSARGAYDREHQLLLDNRTYRGQAGYHVLTPLRLGGSDSRVLVNRGWVATGPDRARLPALPAPGGEVVVKAIIRQPPEKTFRLGETDELNRNWPKVIQQIELAQLEQLLGYPLLPVILLLDGQDTHGFVRDWKPVYGITPDKHRAYALQWFTLAVVLLAIYIGVNTRRTANEP